MPGPHSDKSLRLPRYIGLSVIIILLVASWCSLVFAATPPLNTNLLLNPDAESGTTDGWVCPDRQWVAAAEIAPHGGSKFFWPGRGDVADSSMYQDVDVSGLSSSIDSGTLYMHLSGWLANWNQYPHDRATLAIYALDAIGSPLVFYNTEHRSPSWTQYRIDQIIPPGTRTLRVMLRATRFVGTDDDGYFDDLSLLVNNEIGTTVGISSPSSQSYVTIGSTLALNASTINGTDSGYVWSSSFQSVASVDQNGVVSGIAAGRATIQARGIDSGAIGTFDVSVIPANGLVFIEPSANRSLAGGLQSQVTWSMIGTVNTADLWLSTDGGVSYSPVANISNPSSGVFNWAVPTVASTVRNAVLKLTYSGGESISPLFSIISSYKLDVIINGNGSVHSTDPGLTPAVSCSAGTCSNDYAPGTTINLSASSPWHAQFSGWSGGGCSGTGSCNITMNSPLSVTANFTENANVVLFDSSLPSPPFYSASRIQDAYNALAVAQIQNGAILTQVFTYFENLVFSNPINVVLDGGWDIGWNSDSNGFSTISGTLEIRNGSATVANILIR